MSEETVVLGVDDSKAYAQHDKLEGKVAETGGKAKAVDLEVDKLVDKGKVSVQQTVSIIHRGYSFMMQFLESSGLGVSGVLGAVVNAAFSVAGTLMGLATSLSSNPYTALTAGFVFASAVSSVTTAVKAEQEKAVQAQRMEALKGYINKVTIQL